MASECNGWTNYETWTVNLFVCNESNECIEGAVRASLQDGHGDALRKYVEECFLTDHTTGQPYGHDYLFVSQLLSAAMAEVNWRELRDSYAGQASEYGLDDSDDDEDDE